MAGQGGGEPHRRIGGAGVTNDTAIVVARMHVLSATMSTLGSALETAAPTGDFQSVLDQMQSELDGSTGSAPAANPPAESSAVALASLLEPGDETLSPASAVLGTPDTSGAMPGASGTAPSPLSGADVVADAEQYLGVPYQWGGTSPSTGFDCSGLVQHVYGDLGVSLPRTSEEQSTVGTPVAGLSEAQPGDLVFFEPGANGPGHVGIYIGNGEMIDAPHTGTDVQVQPVGQPTAIRRILPGGIAPASTTSGVPGSIPSSIHVPENLVPLFSQAAARYNVPVALLAAVAQQESGFNAGAVSSAGAEGIMQLMPSTAAGLGVNAFDPAQAIGGAAQLLGGYLRQYDGSIPLALASYNAGPAAVAKYGGVPPYPETTSYVQSILGMLGDVS